MNTPTQKTPLLHDKVAWDGKRLVAANPAVIEQLRRKALSASTAQAMDGCVARWAGERLLPRGEDPFSGAFQGSVVHDFFEKLYALLPPMRTRERVEAMLSIAADKQWPVDPQAPPEVITAVLANRAQWVAEVRFAYEGIFTIEDPKKIRVLALEMKIEDIELDGVPVVGYIDRTSEVESSTDDIGMSIDDYKGLALDTLIPTPSGWTTMEKLAKGDTVFGSDGAPVTVTVKSGTHHRRCFELVFNDGSRIVCDNVHFWSVIDSAGTEITLDAEQLHARVAAGEQFFLPAAGALRLPVSEDPMRGSEEQRRWLLASMTGQGSQGTHLFTTSNPVRARKVFELAASLGMVPVRTDAGGSSTVSYSSTPHQMRSISAVTEVDSVPTQCIAVDSTDSLYLCGEAMIPTHNTGKKIPNPRYGDHYGDQLRVYTRSVHIITGVKPVKAELLYTKVRKAVPVDISERAINKTLKHFSAAWDKHNRYMDEGSFPMETGPLCGWCPLVNSCPMAKAAGLGPRTEGLPSATDLGIPSVRPGIAPVPVVSDALSIVAFSGSDIAFFAPEPADEKIRSDREEVERAAELAAHIYNSGETPEELKELEKEMTRMIEGKPWEVYITAGEGQGQLNPSAYAAGAAFGLAEMAVENLHKAGVKITGKTVKGLASTYHYIVTEAQRSWTGNVSLQESSNARMRGALHTVLRTMPQPWGEDAEAWENWVAKAIQRCNSITAVAVYLFSEPIPESPWAALDGLPAAETAAPAVETPALQAAPVAAAVEAPVAEPAAVVEEPAPAKRKPAARKPAAAKPKPAPEPEPVVEEDDFVGVDVSDYDFG